MRKVHHVAAAAALLLGASTAQAGQYTIANTFSAGTQAIAAQVNANFTNAKTAIDDNNTRITANAANIATNNTKTTANTAAAATNAANIATNTTNITANTTNISANTASAGTNATNITANTANITTNTANIAANTASASANGTNIATNATNISTNLASINARNAVNPVATVVNVPAGGTALANGTALMNAVAGITGSSPATPYTVKLAAGTYDLGTQTLNLPDGTNLEGVAPRLTTVTSAVNGQATAVPMAAAVRALGSSKISKITLINTGTLSIWGPVTLVASTGSLLIEHAEILDGGAAIGLENGATPVTATISFSRVLSNAGGFGRQLVGEGISTAKLIVLSSQFGAAGDIPGVQAANQSCFLSTYSNGTAVPAACQ